MLQGYIFTQDGLIKQTNPQPYIYDSEYINSNYGDKSDKLKLSNATLQGMRLGYVIASNNGKIPDSILDFGYGNGSFLNEAKKIIPTCYGYDISNVSPPEGVTAITDPTKGFYQVVTFLDSLEHLEDIEFVKDVNCEIIVFSVPWCHYTDKGDDWFENWYHRKVNEHVIHGGKNSWTSYFDRMGYDRIFDASHLEDTIRKPHENLPNILTLAFRKRS